jgi:methylaspartate ammonia-lyase
MMEGHHAVAQPCHAGEVPAVHGTRAQRIRSETKLMRTFSVLASCVLLMAAVACARPQKYIDITCGKMPGETLLDREAAIQCQQFRQEEAATAVYHEATLLLKSYRACLEKYEQAPARAREYCGQYGKALQDIGLQIKEPLDTGPPTKGSAQSPPKPK